MPNTLPALAALSLVAALLAGCTSDPGQGSASVYVKDAPMDDFDEIHVLFTMVSVHKAGSGDDEGSDANGTDDEANDTKDNGGGWKVLFSDAGGVDIDLLNASGTRAAFLGERDVPAGKYTQLRITVLEAYGMDNGTRVPITVSSSTLKLNHPFTVQAGNETRLVLDFDLSSSLHQQGNGNWRMTPVVGSVVAQQVDDEDSGSEQDSEGDIRRIDNA